MTRRESFKALFGSTLAKERLQHKNKHARHKDTILYRGGIELPEEVIRLAFQSPLYKTTYRKDAVRFKLDGITYLFRELVAGNKYKGELVRGELGNLRVHLHKAVYGNYVTRELKEILCENLTRSK